MIELLELIMKTAAFVAGIALWFAGAALWRRIRGE